MNAPAPVAVSASTAPLSAAGAAKPDAFRGIWPAMLTPLGSDLAIDQARLNQHALSLLDSGCGGVTPFGTTGEAASFTAQERMAAIDALVAAGVPAARIMVSTSSDALPEVVAMTRHALDIGAGGCLMLPPYYFKGVSDAGILDSYRYVIDRVSAGGQRAGLKLYLYHIPQVAAVGLSHAVIDTLLREYPGIVCGIKDSQCSREHSVALAQAFMPRLTVYVGNELDLPTLGRLGSTGAISGLANFWPRRVHRLVTQPDAALTPDDHGRTQKLLDTLGGYALIPALKGIMAWRDGDEAWLRVRPPLCALDSAGLAALREDLQRIGFDPRHD